MDLPVRLALDVAPVRAQPAGVGLYVARLAGELARQLPESLAVIGVRADAAELSQLPAHVEQTQFRSRGYHSWLQLHADRAARDTGAELVHYTNAAAPLVNRLPYVLTVHDLSLVRQPRTHPLSRRLIVPLNLWAIARARAIVVPSAWTRFELGRLGVSTRRTVVIPHAPAFGSREATDDLADGRLLDGLGLTSGGFLLHIGTLEPRKNLERLVAAFESIAVARPSLKLVLAGAPGWHFARIGRRISSSPFRERIVQTGYLPSEDVRALIGTSGAVAYVSLYEGFGMPVLDAMSLGAAVVTANRTAMPEAAGGAAVLVDPYDVADIARGLGEALDNRVELARASLERAAGRSWADVAHEHIEVYRWALGTDR